VSFFSQRMATHLNRLSLPIVCSMRARSLYRRLGKKRPRSLEFSRRGITGVMPRARAETRFAALSYPLSVTAMRGRIRAAVERCHELRAVAGFATGQVEIERMAVEIGLEVNFGREAATRAAEGLMLLPPLAPAAET
jgi:hypothetical protein